MMPSPDLERAARIIAENVVSAFDREREGPAGLLGAARDMLTARLVGVLLTLMPTADPGPLVRACNFALDDTVGAMGHRGPRVEAIDLGDGSVTMRRG